MCRAQPRLLLQRVLATYPGQLAQFGMVRYICQYVCMCVCVYNMYVCVYIYIYIYIERERSLYIYIYTYIHIMYT